MNQFCRVIAGVGMGMLAMQGVVAHAEEPVAPAARAPALALNIASQPLDSALNLFAQQTGLQIVYLSGVGKGLTSPPLTGNFTPRAALDQLLAGTPFGYEFLNERTIAIRTKTSSVSPNKETPTAQAEAAAALLHMAAVDTSAELQAVEGAPAQRQEPAIPEMLVKGSRLLNADIRRTRDDVQPYVVFDRDTIEKSAAPDIDTFIRQRLPMAYPTFGALPGSTPAGSTSRISLRDLGGDETLILVDGRRVSGYGFLGGPQQPDLNAIPMYAVERIEVLSATASGIYGGSATGGVINVILRRDYKGVETKLTYENTWDGASAYRRADVSAGIGLENGRTTVMLVGSYAEQDPLLVGDRDFVQRGRERIMAKNPATFSNATFPPLGSTTNIRSTGANLTLKAGNVPLGSAFTFVPIGYAGVTSDGGLALVGNAGKYNLNSAATAQTDGGGGRGLRNAPTIKSMAANVRREMTPWLEAFMDFSASENGGSYRTNTFAGTFTLQNTAPSNPFNQAVRVTVPAIGGDETMIVNIKGRKAVGGVIARLPHQWQMGADYSWNRSQSFTSRPALSFDSTTLTAHLNAGTLNVFRDVNAFATDFGAYQYAPSMSSPADATLTDATLRFSGPLAMLNFWGQSPTLSLLAERRKQMFDDSTSITAQSATASATLFNYRRWQTVDSVYLESKVPLGPQLDLQLAARNDRYLTVQNQEVTPGAAATQERNKHDSLDPTVGLRYQPFKSVMFRASYGDGFRPPAVNQLVPGPPQLLPANVVTLRRLTDPRRGNQPVTNAILTFAGGNPDLQPELSRSFSAGLVLTPAAIPGLRLSVDRVKIDKSDEMISSGLAQVWLNNEESLPGLVVRAQSADSFPVGLITEFRGGEINVSRTEVEAYDFAIDYRIDVRALGEFEFSAMGSRLVHHSLQFAPTLAPAEAAGLNGKPAMNGNATLSWYRGNWSLSWTARYFGRYWFNAARSVVPEQGAPAVASQLYHDLYGTLRLDSKSGFWADSEMQLGIRNVFNRQPPVDVTNEGLFSQYVDPALGSYHLSWKKAFRTGR